MVGGRLCSTQHSCPAMARSRSAGEQPGICPVLVYSRYWEAGPHCQATSTGVAGISRDTLLVNPSFRYRRCGHSLERAHIFGCACSFMDSTAVLAGALARGAQNKSTVIGRVGHRRSGRPSPAAYTKSDLSLYFHTRIRARDVVSDSDARGEVPRPGSVGNQQMSSIDVLPETTDIDLIRTRPCPNCYLCGEPGELLYDNLEDRLFDAPGKWTLRRCASQDCGLVWLDPMPLEKEISKAYSKYYTHDDLRADRASLALLLKKWAPALFSVDRSRLLRARTFISDVSGRSETRSGARRWLWQWNSARQITVPWVGCLRSRCRSQRNRLCPRHLRSGSALGSIERNAICRQFF